MKTAPDAVDSEGFAFLQCEVRLPDGSVEPDYWLCDVIRILDALDEGASELKIFDENGRKTYSLMGKIKLVFKEDVVGPAHVFRMAHMEPTIICDQVLKDPCKAAGLKGITFRDVN